MAGSARFLSRSLILWCNTVAHQVAAEDHGHIDDVFRIDVRIAEALRAQPDMLNIDEMARHIRKTWERQNRKAINRRDGECFIPGAMVPTGLKARVVMRLMSPTDLIAWDTIEDEARRNFNDAMDNKRRYRKTRLDVWSRHGDPTLGDLEVTRFGFTGPLADTESHLFGES